MLIIRVGDNIEKRNKADAMCKVDTSENANRSVLVNIFSSMCDAYLKDFEIEGVKQYLGQDIFGGILKVRIENWNTEEHRDSLYKNLEDIQESKNIFIIDEPEMLDVTFKKLSKYAESKNVFDCREIKIKDTRSFDLADALLQKVSSQKENNLRKKNAWLLYVDLIKTEPIESIIGAINYKFKMYKKEKQVGDNLISIAHSHDSKGDAKIDLEKYILSL